MGGVSAGKEIPRIVHDSHAHRDMPRADSEVDQAFAFAVSVPTIDVVGADLQFEGCSHTVVCLKLITARILSMLMQIDEAGRDDEAGSVKGGPPPQRLGGDGDDLSAIHSNVSDAI